MKRLVIVQRVLPHYRVPFFRKLRERLQQKNIELILYYGQESQGAVPATVHIDDGWAIFRRNTYFKLWGTEIVFQWLPIKSICGADLVVLEQANRLLVNHLLFVLRRCYSFKLGLWGHGRNCQSNSPNGFLERFKQVYSGMADWWFSYTDSGKKIITSTGFDSDRVTVVQNSIDSTWLRSESTKVDELDLKLLREELSLVGSHVAVYCGGMYSEKKLNFLISAAKDVKELLPSFEMIFIGDGPDAAKVRDFAEANEWVVYLGALTGVERIKFMKLGKVLLMPGLVGLVVLDSFALGIPLVTTNIKIHSPEIDYLQPGFNGLMTDFSAASYVNQVVDLLKDNRLLETLRSGCDKSFYKYSVENMVDNYSEGVLACLGLKKN